MAPIRFGPFEADARSGELLRDGRKVKLQEQPFQVLMVLLEHAGEVVTREQLTGRLWPNEVHVDFERGLNKAVTRLREALDDSAEAPRYVETLPRRGYRFIAPVSNGAPATKETDELAERVEHAPMLTASTAAVAGGSRHRRLAWFASVLAIFAAAGAVSAWRWAEHGSRVPKVVRFRQLTNDGQAKEGPLVTDGPRVYFNQVLPGPRSVVSQVSIRGGESVRLPIQLPQPTLADASEDGAELLIANHEMGGDSLWIQPVSAGSPRRVGSLLAHDAAFGSSPGSVIFGREKDVYSINQDGTGLRKLLTVPNVAFAFRYSPDHRMLRFTTFDVQIDDMSILEAAASGSESHKMFQGCWGKWTPDGRYFVFQNRHDGRLNFWTLHERAMLSGGKVKAEPVQLTAGPIDYQYPLPSKDGKTIFALGTTHRAELIRYEPRGRQFAPFLEGISAEGLSFSRDGQWVAYTSFPEGMLFRSRVDGSERRQLTFPPLRAFRPRWSPDGEQIAFSGDLPEATTVRNVYVISSEGGAPARILPSDQSQDGVNWSPDGGRLVFGSLFVPTAPILLYDLKTRSAAPLTGSHGFSNPQWSPDGRTIAATTTAGPPKLMLFDLAKERWKEAVAFPVGHYLSWSDDARYIYLQYSRSEGEQSALESIGRLRAGDGKFEHVVDVKDLGRVATGTFVDWFGLAPDNSLLFARDISTQEIYALDVEWP